MKKLFTLILACILLCSTIIPASAAYTFEELLIADGFEYIGDFYEGYAVIIKKTSKGSKYGLINTKGEVVVEPYYDAMDHVVGGLARVGMNTDGDSTTGDFGSMHIGGGMTQVGVNGIDKSGFIDTAGNVVIPLEYEKLGNFSEGLAPFYEEYQYTVYLEGFGDIPAIGHKVGFIDKAGNVVIPCVYGHLVSGFSDGLAIVQQEAGGKCGAIDKSGKIIIPFTYDTIQPFYNGLASAGIMVSDNVWRFGHINKTGKVITQFKYDYTGNFDENGLAPVAFAGNNWTLEYGLINTNGKIVVPIDYYEISAFTDGLARICKLDENGKGKFGFINTNGEFVVQPIYDTAGVFSEGMAIVGMYKNVLGYSSAVSSDRVMREYSVIHYGYIDTQGKVVVPLEYEAAANFSEGIAAVGKNVHHGIYGGYNSLYPASYGFVDANGTEVIELSTNYSGSGCSYEGVVVVSSKKGSAIMRNPLYRESVTALPTSSKVLVNGEEVSFDAYNIKDNNYFKLRDLAYVLSGSEKQFEVTWDGNANAIRLISGKAYTAYGTELAKGDGITKTALSNNSAIYIDGKSVTLTAYNINGNNYFKLRDIGIAFDFDVSWDGEHNVISINTSKRYSVN